jgi:hypothetical protein
MADEIKNEMEVVAEQPVEIAGYKILPWGIQQISRLSPAMKRIYMRMQEDEITLTDMAKDLPKLVFAILPESTMILRETLKITDEEVDKIPQDQLLNMIATIINANTTYLKNWVGLVLQVTRAAKTL